jgi:hypothetical protein
MIASARRTSLFEQSLALTSIMLGTGAIGKIMIKIIQSLAEEKLSLSDNSASVRG